MNKIIQNNHIYYKNDLRLKKNVKLTLVGHAQHKEYKMIVLT